MAPSSSPLPNRRPFTLLLFSPHRNNVVIVPAQRGIRERGRKVERVKGRGEKLLPPHREKKKPKRRREWEGLPTSHERRQARMETPTKTGGDRTRKRIALSEKTRQTRQTEKTHKMSKRIIRWLAKAAIDRKVAPQKPPPASYQITE